MTKIHDCSIARIAILIEILSSIAISIAIRLFLNIACNIAILFGPYFHNIQLQYFFLDRYSHNDTFLPRLIRLTAEHIELMAFLRLA